MLAKQVVLSQMEILPSGLIQVRLDKQVVDGDQVFAREYHRTVFEPGQDPDLQAAAVDAHLAQLGFPAVDAAAWMRVKRVVALEHTPDVIAAYRAAAQPLPAEQAQA